MAILKNLKMNLTFASVGILLAGTSLLVQADTVDDIAAIKNNLEMRTPPI